MKKIFIFTLAIVLVSCSQKVELKFVDGIRSISNFSGFAVKDKTKSVCTNSWHSTYDAGDSIYRMKIEKDNSLLEVSFTRLDYDTYDIGDTIR